MSRKTLPQFLSPADTVVPSVYDVDGIVVTTNTGNKITNELTTVDIGDTPNSNNGDPLRLAFAKINNFIEAMYHYDESLIAAWDSDLNAIRDGSFLGDGLDSDIAAAQAILDTLTSTSQGQLITDVAALQGLTAVHDSEIEVLEADVASLLTTLANPANVADLEAADDALSARIDSNDTDIAALEADVASLLPSLANPVNVADLEAADTALGVRIDTNVTNISDNGDRITVLENTLNLTTITDTGDHESRIITLEGDTTRLDSVEALTNTNNVSVLDHENRISALEGQITTIKTEYNNTVADIAEIMSYLRAAHDVTITQRSSDL